MIMLKRVYNQNRCTGCGICTINCPQKILKISNGHCVITDFDKCTRCPRCQICQQVCPYLAIEFKNEEKSTFPVLLKGVTIPFHTGCYQGMIERLLAEVCEAMKLENKLVIFKSKDARFEINVEIYGSDNYLKDALEYKHNHPEKIVVVYYTDEEPWQHKQAISDFKELDNTPITIFHMLNYFSNLKLKPTSDEYAIDLCEILCISKDAALVAREVLQILNELLK